MKLRFLLIAILCFCAFASYAHVGSPDIFFDGKLGPWTAHITVRMPTVVPGRAEIIAQIQSSEPLTVSFTPLAAKIAITNAPPPDEAILVRGETNLFTGDLWLMRTGAYSIEVRAHGASGDGSVLIPVNSVAIARLPLPSWLGEILAALGILLFCAAMVIVASAAGESTLASADRPNAGSRRKYWIAFLVTGVVLAAALVGGKRWWDAEDADFRARLRDGGWPDLTAEVRTEGSERILRLNLGKKDFDPNENLGLTLDHGKLLHLFVVSLPSHDALAHLHPIRVDDKTFEVPLPPFTAGDYELFCDCAFENGSSSTATNIVHLPPISTAASSGPLAPDPDDSWITDSPNVGREVVGRDSICRLPDGFQVVWKAHSALHPSQDAAFKFQVLDASGQLAALQPYMGMMSHAAILRADGRVFAHLHPTGNYSMAAQMIFDDKMTRETGRNPSMTMITDTPASTISIPYEFPSAGAYRVWVQFKSADKIETAVFDASVN